MRSLGRVVATLGVVLAASAVAWAGGVDNKNNASAEYIRHLSRNAVVGTVDGVALNPAGVTAMEEGAYFNLSNQTVFTDLAHKVDGVELKTTTPIPVLPHLYVLYRHADWAAFGAFTIPGGGGKLDYNDGSATTYGLAQAAAGSLGEVNLSSHVTSVYYGGTAGGAYQLTDQISLSAAMRFIYATQLIQMKTTTEALEQISGTDLLLDEYETARGFGGIFGVNYRPIRELNLSLRYETATRLRWNVDRADIPEGLVTALNAINPALLAGLGTVVPAAGTSRRHDLPMYFAGGAAYRLIPDLELAWSFNYYVHSFGAQQDSLADADANVWADDHRNGWETALGAEYNLTDRLLASTGVQYSAPGAKKRALLAENPALNAFSIGVGGAYEALDGFMLTAGFTAVISRSDINPDTDGPTGADLEVDLARKNVYVFALGAQYKFL